MNDESANGDQSKGLDGRVLARVLSVYRDVLEKRREHINAINVFPVSDADTGSNLFHTIVAMADAVDERDTLPDVAAALTDRALLAGRGASGLIMSQALTGLCSGLRAVTIAGGSELADALALAGRSAYEAVGDPVEGTMLTAARTAGSAARQAAEAGGDALAVATAARDQAWRSVAESPDLLPALAAAGVVDSGAVGYALFLDVLQSHLDGDSMPERELPPGISGRVELTGERFEVIAALGDVADTATLRARAAKLGTTVAMAARAGRANLHLHCQDPLTALQVVSGEGTVERLEVTDLFAQASATGSGTILVGPDVAEADTLIAAGADRLLVPYEPGRLMQSLEAAGTVRVEIVAVGETAGPARETAGLASIDVEIIAVDTPADAAEAIRGRSPT